ncbi:hypothetical protein ACQ86G_14200 [Roseateles chitinivorans]|uniref:hypothetical protein n=1 Tax=Roseateles chitinivorans TaxID=2917965 RepID=UPI003D66D159
MRRRASLMLALACLAAPLAAPLAFAESPDAAAERLRDLALADSTAFGLVESLTTEIGARLAGSEADARAVAWAVARFKALGYDKVSTEPVTFPTWRRLSDSATVVAPVVQRLAVAALGGSVSSPAPSRPRWCG